MPSMNFSSLLHLHWLNYLADKKIIIATYMFLIFSITITIVVGLHFNYVSIIHIHGFWYKILIIPWGYSKSLVVYS
jgi:hypothetical protein